MGNILDVFCYILMLIEVPPGVCETSLVVNSTSPNPPSTIDWAFKETFDGDPSTPSQSLLPRTFDYVATHRSHPKDHFTKLYDRFPGDHDEFCNGPDPNIVPLPQHMVQTRQDSSGSNPDESFYICKNHMMSSMGKVEGYSVSSFWPRQEFDITPKGSKLQFDVNLNEGHTIRSWWEILITPRDELKVGAGPVDSPISETYPRNRIVLSFRRNVRNIRVGKGSLPPDGWVVDEMQFGEYDWAWWRDLHPGDPATNDHRIRRKMVIEFQATKITWGIQKADGGMDEWSADLPSGLPFDKGLVLFKTHAYNPTKDGNVDTYTFHWDNIQFTGPTSGLYTVYEASDVVYLQRNGSREIGETETVTVDLPALTSAHKPVLFGQVHHPFRSQVLLSINGGPAIEVKPYDYENDDCWSADWQSFRLPLNPSDLVIGVNTLKWTIGPRPACAPDPLIEWDGFSVKFLQVQVDI